MRVNVVNVTCEKWLDDPADSATGGRKRMRTARTERPLDGAPRMPVPAAVHTA
jgi:hypothetical protein